LADQSVGVFVQTELVASLALIGTPQAVLGFAFHQRQYRAFVFTAYDQISFPSPKQRFESTLAGRS
jgi:hypothetical protein